MDLLKSLTKKNLSLNKKRTIVTIIGIMLSVALLTAVSSMFASGVKSLINYEKRINGNFHVEYYDVDSNDINTFKQNRAIDKAFVVKELGYAKIDSKNEYKPYAYVLGMDNESMKNLSLNLVKGRLPENDSEVVITTHLKTNGRNDKNIGDEIELNIGTRTLKGEKVDKFAAYEEGEELVDTYSKKYKIVGIIERPSKNIETYDNPGYSIVTYMDTKDITGNVNIYAKYTDDGRKNYIKVTSDLSGTSERALNILLGKISINDNEEYDKASEELNNAKYYVTFNYYLIELEMNPINNNAIGDITKMIAVVCVIIVVTSVFCIKNSFDISITEKIKQYGMLRSVGATKKQIRKNVFYEATILGVIGIVLGILLGLLATFILVSICNYYFESVVEESLIFVFSINIYAIIISVVLGAVTIYLSAIRSAFKASKVSPIESIRNSAEIKIKSKKVKSPKFINKIFGIGGEISYKNLKRNRKKYRTTIISLIVSTAVFVALSYFMSLATDSIKEEINAKDYNLSLSCNGYDDCDEKSLKTVKFDDVKRYTILRSNQINLKEHKVNKDVEEKFNATYSYYDEELKKQVTHSEYDSLTIISVGEEEYKNYLKELGLNYESSKDKAILMDSIVLREYNSNNKMTKKKYKIYDYKAGDKINFSYYTKTDEVSDSIEIVKTADIVPFGTKELINESVSSILIISDSKYSELFKDDLIQKILYDTDNANKLQDDIEKYLDDYKIILRNTDESVRQMKNLITLIGIFLYGFITVITLIGITNIFNTITTSVYLRRREFATLKSVGMTTKEFNRMIRLESIFMGIKSLMFSIPIGIILSYLIFMSIGKEMGSAYHLPVTAIIISICAVFILIALIMKYSVGKVNKQNIIETIRNENI